MQHVFIQPLYKLNNNDHTATCTNLPHLPWLPPTCSRCVGTTVISPDPQAGGRDWPAYRLLAYISAGDSSRAIVVE